MSNSEHTYTFEDLDGVADTPSAESAGDDATEYALEPETDGEGAEGDEPETAEASPPSAQESEIEALRREIAELRSARDRERTEAQIQAQSAELDEKIEAERKAMVEAQEQGETETASKHQAQLVQLTVQRETGRPVAPSESAQEGARRLPQAADEWMLRNNTWFGHPSYQNATRRAIELEQQFRAQGADSHSRTFYDQLDQVLRREYPHLYGTSKPARTAPTNGMGAQAPAGKGKVRITQDDLSTMRTHGLDPDDPAHLKAWAREKRALQTNRASR